MTWTHAGLILVFIGTVMIGFSVKVRRQYDARIVHILDVLKKENPFVEPMETRIDLGLLWSGLLLILSGTVMQW